MRKWIVIAVVLVTGFVAWVFFVRHDPVEYHLQQYLRAQRALVGKEPPAFMDRARDAVRKMLGGRPRPPGADIREHERELIRLGYLEERTFVVSNVGLSNVAFAVRQVIIKKGTNLQWTSAGRDPVQTNGVRVVTRKGSMFSQEDVLREIEARTQVDK